jgi:pimeloyl-ACP methyl ester carboxylesterase
MQFDFNGRQIYFEQYGQGEPLLVLNGIFMNSASWAPFVPALSRQHRLILVDLLDQGRSARMSGDYGQALQAEVAYALLEHLSVLSCNILGISYGGQIALRLAFTHPHRVKRLILANTTAYVNPWLEDLGHAWSYALASHDARQFFKTCMPLIYSPGFYTAQAAWLHAREKVFQERFTPEVYDGFLRLLKSTEGLDLLGRLGEIAAPTLVISADSDYITPPADQAEILARMPQAKQIVLRNCGHASMYEQPVEFMSAVLGFLAADPELRVV